MTWPITQYPVSGGHDEEVASEKNNEFKRRVQKSIPYQLPKWWQKINGLNQHPIYDQNCWKTGRTQNAEPYSMEYPMEYLKWSTPKNHVLVK